MRDDDEKQLAAVNNLIKKAKISLQKMEDFDVPKTLEMELVDIIPLGQFPDQDDKNKK